MRLAIACSMSVLALLTACAGSKGLPDRSASETSHGVTKSVFKEVKLPPGFQQVMSDVGPVFADGSGRTLYSFNVPNTWCKDEHDPLPDGADPLLSVYAQKANTCAHQWPPVLASEDAKPIGDWTVVVRPDGAKQWAYQSHPLHYSYKDRLPGDVNGVAGFFRAQLTLKSFSPLAPTLTLPPGMASAWYPGVGLVATSASGRALYTLDQAANCKTAKDQHGKCVVDSARWSALVAGDAADWRGEPWSLVKQPDGTKVWGFRGQPIYAFAGDDDPAFFKGLGVELGATPVVLKAVARAPKGVTVNRTLVGPVYSDGQGKTLYTFNCENYAPAGLSASVPFVLCDDWTDDPALGEQFCEARDRCAERWQPFAAPASARPRGGVWSVAVIPDPKYPLRWKLTDSAEASSPNAIKVWTYEGRPLYTFLGDHGPGDWNGHEFSRLAGPIWSIVLAGPRDLR